ncbi:hypothetical protein EV361DRAFT_319865 [Lentinula raphanica]|nr:hypothetical protein F5880DRAFT_1275643 [Lentinula raphanica]KAJ3969941.1 hypothetical protein EV361DRAFT_319865 [Lentinula raphanica]
MPYGPSLYVYWHDGFCRRQYWFSLTFCLPLLHFLSPDHSFFSSPILPKSAHSMFYLITSLCFSFFSIIFTSTPSEITWLSRLDSNVPCYLLMLIEISYQNIGQEFIPPKPKGPILNLYMHTSSLPSFVFAFQNSLTMWTVEL